MLNYPKMTSSFFRILLLMVCAVQGLQAQDGPAMPLQPAVSIMKVGAARELPSRMDFYTIQNPPYSRQVQSKSAESTWQGLEADLAAAFVEWMRTVRGIQIAYDPLFFRDAAELKTAMMADPAQAVGVMVIEEGVDPLLDSAWSKPLPWLRSKMGVLVPLSNTANWNDWKTGLKSAEGARWVVHRSPMSLAWMRAWSVQVSSKGTMEDTDDELAWWKVLGKSKMPVVGVADVGTLAYAMRQEGAYAWKVKVPEGQKNSIRYLVFPRQSLLAPYWEEFLWSGWGWTSSKEFKGLLEKHFDQATPEHIQPVRP